MTQTGYSVTFDCYDRFGWEEFWCDINDTNSYDEMINDIKYAAREYGGGHIYIYDGDGELIEELNVFKRSAAIYQIDDEVSFLLDSKEYIGIIVMVDAFGTFFDNSEPYYDIRANNILYKHIPQSVIRKV